MTLLQRIASPGDTTRLHEHADSLHYLSSWLPEAVFQCAEGLKLMKLWKAVAVKAYCQGMINSSAIKSFNNQKNRRYTCGITPKRVTSCQAQRLGNTIPKQAAC